MTHLIGNFQTFKLTSSDLIQKFYFVFSNIVKFQYILSKLFQNIHNLKNISTHVNIDFLSSFFCLPKISLILSGSH